MTVIFNKKATNVVTVTATNDAAPATGNQSPLWKDITRDIAGGSYARTNAAVGNKLNRVVNVDSIERFSVMTTVFCIPVRDTDIIDANAADVLYIKIPFTALQIEPQELYGITLLGYKKINPTVNDFDFIAAAPHYALPPAAGDTTDKVPVRIVDAIQSDREKITIKISVPANAGQLNGVMTRAMMRSLLVGNFIVLQLLTTK